MLTRSNMSDVASRTLVIMRRIVQVSISPCSLRKPIALMDHR